MPHVRRRTSAEHTISKALPGVYVVRVRGDGPQTRSGTAFVIDNGKKWLATCDHVIESTAKFKVREILIQGNGQSYSAVVIASDSTADVALLKVETTNHLVELPLDVDSPLAIGNKVIAIGTPFGLAKTTTFGHISALNRPSKNRAFKDLIQTDAPVNRGNSGGPLLNMEGQVIGIVSSTFRGTDGIGFAIPAKHIQRLMKVCARLNQTIEDE